MRLRRVSQRLNSAPDSKILKLVLTRCDGRPKECTSSADISTRTNHSRKKLKRSQILRDRWKEELIKGEGLQDTPLAGMWEASSLITEQRAALPDEQVSPGSDSTLAQPESSSSATATVPEITPELPVTSSSDRNGHQDGVIASPENRSAELENNVGDMTSPSSGDGVDACTRVQDQSPSGNLTEIEGCSKSEEASKETTSAAAAVTLPGRAVTLCDTTGAVLRVRAFFTTPATAQKLDRPAEQRGAVPDSGTPLATQQVPHSCSPQVQTKTEVSEQSALSLEGSSVSRSNRVPSAPQTYRRHTKQKKRARFFKCDVLLSQNTPTLRRSARFFKCDVCPAVFQHPYNVQYHRLRMHHSSSFKV